MNSVMIFRAEVFQLSFDRRYNKNLEILQYFLFTMTKKLTIIVNKNIYYCGDRSYVKKRLSGSPWDY